MAFEKGNEYGKESGGGRPPIYSEENEDDIAKVKKLCEEYYEYIKGEYKEDEFEEEPGKFVIRKEWVRNPEPPTVTGLTLFLGFESKTTLYEYSRKPVFMNSIKRALTKIEQYHEIATSMGDKCTGNIFILKNFDWHDSIRTEHSGEIKNGTPPMIVFVDTDDSDED